MSKNVHKFDNLSRKILIMTLKMTVECRVRTQNELLIKLYKKYENWLPILNEEGVKIAKTFRKNAIFANFNRFGRSKIR